MAAHSHVWITDRKSMQALGSIRRSKEAAGERQKFGSWKTINNNNHFYSLSPIPPRFDGTLPGNGLPSQWRRTSGIKEKSRKSAAAKWRGSGFLKVCIDDSTLIIPPVSQESKSQNTVSEVMLMSYIFLPVWHIKEGNGTTLKGIDSDTSWLKLPTYWRRHKGKLWDCLGRTRLRFLLF